MDPELRKELSRRGRSAAHAKGVAHEWTQDEARAAGRKGGNRHACQEGCRLNHTE